MKKIGRPSKYKPEYNDQAYGLCLLSATDQELAVFFDVSLATLHRWKIQHPLFRDALKNGKDVADANVGKRLYQRACGYSHPEDKIFVHNGEPVIVPTIKHYPPDTTACIFWLKNRQPAKWRDVHNIESTDTSAIDKLTEVIQASKDKHGVE